MASADVVDDAWLAADEEECRVILVVETTRRGDALGNLNSSEDRIRGGAKALEKLRRIPGQRRIVVAVVSSRQVIADEYILCSCCKSDWGKRRRHWPPP